MNFFVVCSRTLEQIYFIRGLRGVPLFQKFVSGNKFLSVFFYLLNKKMFSIHRYGLCHYCQYGTWLVEYGDFVPPYFLCSTCFSMYVLMDMGSDSFFVK